jgi:4'-phosphopantetheinyl transferase
MMEVEPYWLQQTDADVPSGVDWLSGDEAIVLQGFRFAKRRNDWRLGRWTAKCAVAAYLKLPVDPARLAKVEIRALPSGAPQVLRSKQPAPVAISLSHRNGIGLCAVAEPDTAIGCDLEIAEAHSTAFMRDYFLEEEEKEIARARIASRPLLVAVLWSAKESALKALHEGLRLDTRSVSVRLGPWEHEPGRWYPLQVHYVLGEVFCGWWQRSGNLVRTLVAHPRPRVPVPLSAPAFKRAPDTVSAMNGCSSVRGHFAKTM